MTRAIYYLLLGLMMRKTTGLTVGKSQKSSPRLLSRAARAPAYSDDRRGLPFTGEQPIPLVTARGVFRAFGGNKAEKLR